MQNGWKTEVWFTPQPGCPLRCLESKKFLTATGEHFELRLRVGEDKVTPIASRVENKKALVSFITMFAEHCVDVERDNTEELE